MQRLVSDPRIRFIRPELRRTGAIRAASNRRMADAAIEAGHTPRKLPATQTTSSERSRSGRAGQARPARHRTANPPLPAPRLLGDQAAPFGRPLQGPLAGRGQDHEKPDGKRSEEGGHPASALGSHIKPSPAGNHKTGQDGGDKGRHGQEANAGFRPLRARVIPIQGESEQT